EPEAIAVEGVGETCPECNEGTLVAKRGRFGPFAGCSRYPDCKFIKKSGPPPPDPLPFDVVCPKCNEGQLTARRARRTGSVFWGCSRYPKCDFTSSREPLGAFHETDDGPVAREGEAGAMCLKCGAAIEATGEIVPGSRLAGGEPNPEALAPPRRGRGGSGRSATGRAAGSRRPSAGGGAARTNGRRARPAA
ncbi:MAG TPA: topoisomerase DNA-binding C4 zinc finger domain-containing protein, partial [Candidatus Limnocylindrales bacterium]|nr:topoisomerase DNA-binding C4 zinc finger domain-containing protein [Candidatus Limnocylindrales bacterium]